MVVLISYGFEKTFKLMTLKKPCGVTNQVITYFPPTLNI